MMLSTPGPALRPAWEIFYECWHSQTEHLKTVPPIIPERANGAPGLRALESARTRAQQFLLATEALGLEEVASIAGVSVVAIRPWTVSPPGQMRRDLRDRLLRYLEPPAVHEPGEAHAHVDGDDTSTP